MSNDKLHNIKKAGYKIPEGYFDSVEDNILNKINSPFEDVNASGYEVPDNYFNSIEDKVLDRVALKKGKLVNLFTRRNLMYLSGVAAALLIMISVVFKSDPLDETLDIEMVETYLEEQDLDSYELAELLAEADLLDEDFTVFDEENLDDSEIEAYLLENINIEDIIEQ